MLTFASTGGGNGRNLQVVGKTKKNKKKQSSPAGTLSPNSKLLNGDNEARHEGSFARSCRQSGKNC